MERSPGEKEIKTETFFMFPLWGKDGLAGLLSIYNRVGSSDFMLEFLKSLDIAQRGHVKP